MPDPKRTGISKITGKLVVIRHATDTDRVRLRERFVSVEEDLLGDVVIALENDRIIGFGYLKRDDDSGCMSIFEDSRRKGIGLSIKRHLMAVDPPVRVYTTRTATYFAQTGLRRRKQPAAGHAVPALTTRCSPVLMERVAV